MEHTRVNDRLVCDRTGEYEMTGACKRTGGVKLQVCVK